MGGYPATYGYGLGVSHYGYPYSTYSQRFYGKREADAEPEAKADPQYLTRYTTPHAAYSNYGYGFPSTYGYGFPSTYGYGFPSTYGYSRYGYGKREAEAEPEAEPYLYGSYAHGYYPRTYANYGYGYPAYTTYG